MEEVHSPPLPSLTLASLSSTTTSICPEMNRCRHLRGGTTYARISPPTLFTQPSFSTFLPGTRRSHHNGWGGNRGEEGIGDAVTKYCLSPQDTRSVSGFVTSYIKWPRRTICCMTAHLRHNIIQRDRGVGVWWLGGGVRLRGVGVWGGRYTEVAGWRISMAAT